MKEKMKILIPALAAILSGATGMAAPDATPTLQAVKVRHLDLYRQGDRMHVSFELDLDDLALGRNGQAIYTPVLVNGDGTQSASFGKIVINGRNAHISEQRSPRLRVKDAAAAVVRRNGTQQQVNFSGTVPYSAWMDRSTLSLLEDLCGCGDLLSQDRKDLALFDNTPVPAAAVAFAEPQKEVSKAREERGSASIDFVANRTAIRPDYRNNRAEIAKIVSTIDKVRNDRNAEITGIEIHGYASPEGAYAHNATLAEQRTKALTDYVKGLYDIPADRFTMGFTAEDWEGLRRLVEGSDMAERDALLSIIDDGSLAPDAKEQKIKDSHAEAYAFMLKEWYPSLRHSDYTVAYTVRPFTTAEALAVMKTTPGQVSLYEMYQAAQTLGPDSEGYAEIMELAVRTYPDNPDANYNAAVLALKRGNLEEARKFLAKVPESARTLNLRGAMALNGGDSESARHLFRQASDRGLAEAAGNLELVDRLEALKKQNR